MSGGCRRTEGTSLGPMAGGTIRSEFIRPGDMLDEKKVRVRVRVELGTRTAASIPSIEQHRSARLK